MFGFEIRITTGTSKKEKKVREFKGVSANKHVDDYCVVDLETTDKFIALASIIEISALKVRNNEVVAEYNTLVNPECEIPEEVTAINHITDDMVKDAPLLEDVIDDFLAFVGDDVIVGFNNAAFDMNVLYDEVLYRREKPFSNNFLDVYHASRRSIEGLSKYSLEMVSKHYGFDTSGEHRATKDCYLTKNCYDKLYEDNGDVAFQYSKYGWKPASTGPKKYKPETIAQQKLQDYLTAILNKDRISSTEIDSLRDWIEEYSEYSGKYPFRKVFHIFDYFLEEGEIPSDNYEALRNTFELIVHPVDVLAYHGKISTLCGKHVCITGKFDYGSDDTVKKLIVDAGGINDAKVVKATDYLIVGAQGSPNWKTGNFGQKIDEAATKIDEGKEIKIVRESDFIPRAEYLAAHPEEWQTATEAVDWQTPVQTMLNALAAEEELPDGSLYIVTNYGRDGKTVTSYSICIYEPDYPQTSTAKDATRNSNVLNIKDNGAVLELMVAKEQLAAVPAPADVETKELKSDKLYTHVFIPAESAELVDFIRQNTRYAYQNYASKASSFGCCGRYNECSDAKKCIHPNKLYARACGYRKNLEAGKIFYGKNRNID